MEQYHEAAVTRPTTSVPTAPPEEPIAPAGNDPEVPRDDPAMSVAGSSTPAVESATPPATRRTISFAPLPRKDKEGAGARAWAYMKRKYE
ncbi:hypothetical protein PG984_000803 [Apiospora sp. TS-2023a]